jgi:hypothetical protein
LARIHGISPQNKYLKELCLQRQWNLMVQFLWGGYEFSFVVWDCSSKGFRSQVLYHILLNYIQVMKAGRWIRYYIAL